MLLSELVGRKIKVIFCDSKSNPQSELMAYDGCHNSTARIIEQINWDDSFNRVIWMEIVQEKILSQAKILDKYNHENEANMLKAYAGCVEPGDITNREGHAAKVYFNAAFGKAFTRADDSFFNACLNYGYSILLSAFNREINAYGCLTQLGIHHCGEYNPFNLSCDFMEPFRPIIDDYVLSGVLSEDNFKSKLANIYNLNVTYEDKSTRLEVAIRTYVQRLLGALQLRDRSRIRFLQAYEF
jgi:CRISPR-associated endonuclease Cas1 subtype II